MRHQDMTRLAVAAGSAALASAAATAAEVDQEGIDKALEALKTYDWGTDRETMVPIDEAVMATPDDPAVRKDLEARLTKVLAGGPSRSATDYICRTLKTIGTAQSVPTLAALLTDEEGSHMARYALERISAPEAAAALRDALPKLNGPLKVGAIGSLGVRRDAASAGALTGLLGDADRSIVCAAAGALGRIGSPQAGKALAACAKKAGDDVEPALVDACFVCADRLLADGKKAEATGLYKTLAGEDNPKHVRFAATRGMLAVAGKKD